VISGSSAVSGGGGGIASLAADAELRSMMVYIVEALKRLLPKQNVINERSTKTLLKHHIRDIADLVAKLRLFKPEEDRGYHKKSG
jgi:hypothetical protein